MPVNIDLSCCLISDSLCLSSDVTGDEKMVKKGNYIKATEPDADPLNMDLMKTEDKKLFQFVFAPFSKITATRKNCKLKETAI